MELSEKWKISLRRIDVLCSEVELIMQLKREKTQLILAESFKLMDARKRIQIFRLKEINSNGSYD